jgi:hypothetical protein
VLTGCCDHVMPTRQRRHRTHGPRPRMHDFRPTRYRLDAFPANWFREQFRLIFRSAARFGSLVGIVSAASSSNRCDILPRVRSPGGSSRCGWEAKVPARSRDQSSAATISRLSVGSMSV